MSGMKERSHSARVLRKFERGVLMGKELGAGDRNSVAAASGLGLDWHGSHPVSRLASHRAACLRRDKTISE